jgi:ectoine hydroxylase-related dioxygenase (phytanoyl-CoA dioxygenase family)
MSTLSLLKEEMNVQGTARLGPILDEKEVRTYFEDLLKRKREDIERFGEEALVKNGEIEVVHDLARFGGISFSLLERPSPNEFVNTVLNDKVVVHSYNAIITRPDVSSPMLGYRFHRDQPFFKNTRTSMIVMIALVDDSEANGSTEFVPGTHLFDVMPSDEFLERHVVRTSGVAGEAFAVDSALWHRAGRNQSADVRPLIAIKYALAPFKQQIDFLQERKGSVAGRLGSRACATRLERAGLPRLQGVPRAGRPTKIRKRPIRHDEHSNSRVARA